MNTPPQNIDTIVDQFEAEWRSGSQPSISDYIAWVPEVRISSLLKLLIPIDIEYRVKRGDDVVAGDYEVLGSNYRRIVEDAMASQFENRNNDTTKTVDHQAKTSKSRVIGNYKLLQKLGEGGMGTVWMAEQEKPVRRRVALKLIKAGHDSKEVVARFEAERQALAMMDHHNIAKVLDGGTTETGQPYFVMELVQGIPFNKYCDQHKLSINERLDLFVPICNAVQHAHQKGIIHRDLKPSNILVSLYDGKPVPKVIDFGLAKALQHQSKLTDKTLFTEFGQVVGTLQYMSPEQAEMNQLDVDTRTDIYSLGVILYELLTGSTPIDAETLKNQAIFKVLESIREKEPPRPSARLSSSTNEAVSGISQQRQIDPSKLKNILRGELDWIVMKALEKDRSRRYETASGFAEDVKRYIDGDVVYARPQSRAYRLRKYLHKHKGFVASVCSFIGLLLIGIVTTGLLWLNASNLRKTAVEKSVEAEYQAKVAEQKSGENEDLLRDAEKQLARTNYFLAIARSDAYREKEANDLLQKIGKNFRNIEWYFARQKFSGGYLTINLQSARSSKIAFTPNGENISIACNDGYLVWDATTGALKQSIKGTGSDLVDFHFYHEEQKIALVYLDGSLVLADVATGTIISKVEKLIDLQAKIRFSSDGQRLYWCTEDGQFKEWSVATSVMQRQVTLPFKGSSVFDISVDGTKIAWGDNGGIRIFDVLKEAELHNSSRTRLNDNYMGNLKGARFSPDGSKVAAWSEQGFICWKIGSGDKAVQVDTKTRGRAFGFCFSPDGSKIAYEASDLTMVVDSNTGQVTHKFATADNPIQSLCFSPDSRRLGRVSFDQLDLFDLSSENHLISLNGHSDLASSLDYSPDGSLLATGGNKGELRIWDAKTGMLKYEHQREIPIGCLRLDQSNQKLYLPCFDTVKCLSLTSNKCLWEGKGHVGRILDVDLSNDGSWLATGGEDGDVRVWRNGIQTHVLRLHTNPVQVVRFSPDQHRIATGGQDKSVLIWDVTNGELQQILLADHWVHSLAYSPDGRHLAVGTVENIHIWDLAALSKVREFRADSNTISDLSYNSDGTRLASSSEKVKLWDTTTWEELLAIDASGWCNKLQFHPSDHQLAWIRSSVHDQIAIMPSTGGHPDVVENVKGASKAGVEFQPHGENLRRHKNSVNYTWHVKQLGIATRSQDILSIAFHLGWMLKLRPNDAVNYIMFEKAKAKLDDAKVNPITYPSIVIEASSIPMGSDGDPEAIWDLAHQLKDANSQKSRALYSLALKNYIKEPSSASLGYARALLLVGEARKSLDDSLESIAWSFLPPETSPIHPAFATPFLSKDAMQSLFDRITALGFSAVDFSTKVLENELQISYVFEPKWHDEELAWWMKAFQSPEQLATFNQTCLNEGYLVIRKTEDLVDGKLVCAGLWHRNTSRLSSFNKLKKLNAEYWNRVKNTNEKQLTEEELGEFSELCVEFSLGRFHSTLGIAQFRKAAFDDAIKSLELSLEKTPMELNLPDPHPNDLAFIALSYLRLNREKEANEFYAKFKATMLLDAFKNDKECLGFSKEVEDAFQSE